MNKISEDLPTNVGGMIIFSLPLWVAENFLKNLKKLSMMQFLRIFLRSLAITVSLDV